MKSRLALALLCGVLTMPALGEERSIEATTSTGERVRLKPNGHWEWADPQKQAEAKKTFENYPENRNPDAQGRLLGIGRAVNPGEKDYNRGTLNPKVR